MLTKLELRNYRGFGQHSLSLSPMTVLVGRNNAGKSTIVEALRLISIVTERLSGLHFKAPPTWADVPLRSRGLQPSLRDTGIDFPSICHHYGTPPATIIATFAAGERIELHLNADGEGHAVLFDAYGELVRRKGRTFSTEFPRLYVLPQVAPLEPTEKILSIEHVRRNLSSPLAPRHFRNQLRLMPSEYRQFRSLAEETWPGLQIRGLEGADGLPDTELFLGIRDRDFVAEVARMGHGLQMWLQTMWFLARTPSEASVVLDEPDVYMHPDLQRRMIRIVRDRLSQVLVATHSVEIMAEVAPSEVLIIDRDRDCSAYANSDPAVQELVDRLGGIHNIHLARLWNAKRCLLVEGKDLGFLRLVHDLLFPGSDRPLDDIPNWSIGGWGNWNYAIGSSLFIRNSVGENVSVYCVLDSDYHTEAVVRKRLTEATGKNVRLHVWRRKEIENYFLIPSVIARVVNARSRDGSRELAASDVVQKLDDIAESLRLATQDDYANELHIDNKSRGLQSANRRARELLDQAFATHAGKIAVVSGKKLLGALGQWTQKEFGVPLGVAAIIRKMMTTEVPAEVKSFVEAVHHNRELSEELWGRDWKRTV